MTDQEINERVAALCGWTILNGPYWKGWYKEEAEFGSNPPNYSESLDACREFETDLTGDGRSLYMDYLYLIVIQSNNHAVMGFENQWAMFNVTPLQRCEAFLRLKGQWE